MSPTNRVEVTLDDVPFPGIVEQDMRDPRIAARVAGYDILILVPKRPSAP